MEAMAQAPSEIARLAYSYGQKKKRNNAIVALLSGAVPGVVLAFYFPFQWHICLVGVLIGLIWGNAFEYAYHRWVLHRPHCALAKGHRQHHANIGTPEEPEHVSLGKSPPYIALLFISNGIVVITVDSLLHLWFSSGIFFGWTTYLIVAEEIHWRIHMNGWLPPGLRFARAYHMAHHDIPNSRYNVFLPLFDLSLGTARGRQNRMPPGLR